MTPRVGSTPLADIFISYARSNAATAANIAEAFAGLGYTVWRDDSLPAHRAYADEIQAELDAARAVVVIWSADAARSEWVRSEADRARAQRKLVQVTVDGAALPMPFDQIQCADLASWRGDPDAAGWRTVLASVSALTDADPDAAPGGVATARRPGTVLAVLPFDNLSSDPEMQFFSDGVSEEIIRLLSRGAGLQLIGRTSSFQFRGERKAEAAERLRCSHVLDGTIRRAATRVRVSAHLIEAATGTTLWSDRYDRGLEDIFSVQDEISESIAQALDRAFAGASSQAVNPTAYDLYLRASPRSYAPEELRIHIGFLEIATQLAESFTEAWARLAYLRAWVRFYEPYAERAAATSAIEREADRALAEDPQNVDALVAKLFVIPPCGRFVELDAALDRLRNAAGAGDGKKYVGWCLRTMGRVREALVEDERTFAADPLDPMSANVCALARMAAGRVEEAVPIYEDLMRRVSDMSFPFTSLLRAKALLGDWPAVDELLALAAQRPVREFADGVAFIRTKRDPSARNIARWREDFEEHVSRTGCVDVSRLVYAAHLGLIDEAYEAAEGARLGPDGSAADVMGPDAYRTSILFQAGLPELRNDPRFVGLCARLGLVEYWTATERWPDCAEEVPYDFRAESEQARGVAKEVFGDD
jgi:TolB-like protein